jgi:hypothetical protein
MSSRSHLFARAKALPAVRVTRLEGWIAGAFVAVACSLLALVLGADMIFGDTLMNLYAGRYIAAHGVPYTDPFTTAGHGRQWIDGQWLANLVFYGASRIGGLWLVGQLSAAAIVSGLVLLSTFLRRRGASFGVQLLGPPAWLAVNTLAAFPRAQSLVIPLFVALIWIIVDEHGAAGRPVRRTSLSVAALVAILLLWANLHGSSVMAVGLAVAYAAYRCTRHLRGRVRLEALPWASLLVLAPVSALATPYGFHVFDQFRAILANPEFHRAVAEWENSWQGAGRAYGLPALVFAIVVGAVAWRRRRAICLPLAACVATLAVATVFEARYAVWLALATVATLGDLSAGRPRKPASTTQRRLPLTHTVAAGFVLLGTCLIVASARDTRDAHVLSLMPYETTQVGYRVAQADPHALVLADLDSSALMLWLHPDMRGRVAFDPRLEIYRPPDLRRWLEYTRVEGSDWFSLARGADILLATKAWSPHLTRELEKPRPGWRSVALRDGAMLVRTR